MAEILIGTCSWTEETLVKGGKFYPPGVKDADSRLRYYASQFPIVEVDSSYYSMPYEKTTRLWVERTPDDFTFNVKSFRLFTRHQTPPASLPADIRQQLPASLKEKDNLYENNMPAEFLDEIWKRFESALLPLDSAGKLGVVLFQFPPWFNAGEKGMDYILSCKERLSQYRLAVEFRNNTWLSEQNREQTLGFLRENDLPYVCVDEPQGFKSSMPPVAEATSDTAIIRFHGRNTENWEKKGIKASDRFNWYYNEDELKEWVPRIDALSPKVKWFHLLFNTHYDDQAIVNARKLSSLLDVHIRQYGQLTLGLD
ncbi:MAG: DUF72 domain-containing protein [Dehalococcoidia bacterium]